MPKKILVVDDSALMRRVLCDIIDTDIRFQVADRAKDGLEAFDLLSRNSYDAVVLDVNMPRMNGLQLLQELRKYKIPARVMMASTDTKEGARTTLDALELGALDFVHKPDSAVDCRGENFRREFLRTLNVVANSKLPVFAEEAKLTEEKGTVKEMMKIINHHPVSVSGSKVVAIASSTGGPKSLQSVIPLLPANLDAPVLVVQHMPVGFTASLAERLDNLSQLHVKEAAEGEELKKGWVYIAMGGKHLNVVTSPAGRHTLHLSEEPYRVGVRPCANYMYESLQTSRFDSVVCAVMTGMGADGTEGIGKLKASKKSYVIAQDQDTSVVFGMPKSIIAAGLADQVVPLDQIAQEIILHVGVVK